MSGPNPRRVLSTTAGWVLPPKLSKDRTEEIFGSPISSEAWRQIEIAWRDFGTGIDDLGASRINNNRNDPLSWGAQKAAVSRELEAMLKALDRIGLDNGKFLGEASESYWRDYSPYSQMMRAEHLLDEVADRVLLALTIVERAEPEAITLPSEPDLRKHLAVRLFDILSEELGEVTLSNGWNTEGAAPADLTAFERFISESGIHVEATADAGARWVRKTLEKRHNN